MQSILKVLPSSGPTEREVLPSNGANQYNRFDAFQELATNCIRDHHLLMVVPPWSRVQSSAWVVTGTIESVRRLSLKAMVPNGASIRTMNLRFVTQYIKSKMTRKRDSFQVNFIKICLHECATLHVK